MTKFRALVGVFAVVLFAFGLTACGSDGDKPNYTSTVTATKAQTPTKAPTTETPTPSDTPSVDDSISTEPSTSTGSLSPLDEQFVQIVRSEVEALNSTPDDEVVYLGSLVCKDFAGGGTVDQVLVDVMSIPGIDAYDTGFFTSLSVQAYCPQYAPLIDQFLATAVPTS